MKRFLLPVTLALVLVLLLAGCRASGTRGTPVATPTPANAAGAATTAVDSSTPTAPAANPPDIAPAGGETAAPTRFPAERYADLRLVTLLPRDAIPAIDQPQFWDAAQADEFYDDDEQVIGVEFNGDARAYSIPLLSRHEIVNDTVGGVKIAVTW